MPASALFSDLRACSESAPAAPERVASPSLILIRPLRGPSLLSVTLPVPRAVVIERDWAEIVLLLGSFHG